MWAVSAEKSCECWAPYLAPTDIRTTTGIVSIPADIACHLESWLKSSSPARPIKSAYISSATSPATLHPVTDGRPDDACLGDGRVEQPVVGEGLCEPAVHSKCAAPVPVFLAEGDHGGVDREAVQHRFEDGVTDVEYLHLGYRRAVGEGRADLAP